MQRAAVDAALDRWPRDAEEFGDLPRGEPFVIVVGAMVNALILRWGRATRASRFRARRSARASTSDRLREPSRTRPRDVSCPLATSLATLLTWQLRIAAACS